MNTVLDEHKNMLDRILKTETFCQTVSDFYDNYASNKQPLNSEIVYLRQENDRFSSKVAQLEQLQVAADNCSLDIQCELLKNNLIFFGIDEAQIEEIENGEKIYRSEPAEISLRKALKTNIDANDDINTELIILNS